ncbi:Radical SAM domain protein [Desulfosarcina cetonica]|uniref:radical SAM (seleno)protein TrsS n=1 Tax=Desulfosarcina cetonica TaxID=90730 RepID=UPI0006CF53C4|nr:radical SAM (seleno)protein TrsS [Desulfosarcina cetonica]VTR67727.1 Radical SAM domain protein [Desulfosarcina cetonica]
MASTSNKPENPADDTVGRTLSLCPVCLKRIEAVRREIDGEVWLCKHCPEHGEFKTPVWRGNPSWRTWQRPKTPAAPVADRPLPVKGCPFDCGLCRDHHQRSCTVVIDVTQRCDLVCPICFARSTHAAPEDPDRHELERRFARVARTSPGSNIQLSGGEPTMRDDLPEIVAIGRKAGFGFIQLNTNGIRISRDDGFLRRLADAGLDSVFLQFDGTQDAIFRKTRGRDLLSSKLAAIEACARVNVGVVLVVTVVPGVNDGDLGAILKLGAARTPVVRGVHFQPISYFGRFPKTPQPEDRITLPELMRAIEVQTDGAFAAKQFSPPGCENAMCSFSAKFMVQPDLSVRPLMPVWQGCCGTIETAEEGARRSISQTARQWSGVPRDQLRPQASPAMPLETASVQDNTGAMDLDQFLRQVRTRTLAVSAMAFQDAWTLDLERVQDCCIHVADDKGRLIPFCLYNLTSIDGKGLYRP